MTHIHRLTEHTEQIDQYIDDIENPDDWVVLVGGFSGEYNVTAPGASPTDPNNGNDLFEIGSAGFAGEAFAADTDPVYEFGHGDSMRTAFMQTLIVHRDILSEEVIENVYGDEREEVPADD